MSVAADRKKVSSLNRAFFRRAAERFAEHEDKHFMAGRFSGVLVVVAREGSTKARDLEELVEDDWFGHFDGLKSPEQTGEEDAA